MGDPISRVSNRQEDDTPMIAEKDRQSEAEICPRVFTLVRWRRDFGGVFHDPWVKLADCPECAGRR